jgi:hypothetical protein
VSAAAGQGLVLCQERVEASQPESQTLWPQPTCELTPSPPPLPPPLLLLVLMPCSGVDIYTAVSGAVGALYGPLHGGANEAVLRMLQRIGSVENIPSEWWHCAGPCTLLVTLCWRGADPAPESNNNIIVCSWCGVGVFVGQQAVRGLVCVTLAAASVGGFQSGFGLERDLCNRQV